MEKEEFIEAVRYKEVEEVKRLLEKENIDVNYQDQTGRTALHMASANGEEELVRMILDKKPDLELKTEGGSTALHWASFNGHFNVVQSLIEAGSNVNSINNNSKTPLDEAASNNQNEVMELLHLKGGKSYEVLKEGMGYEDEDLIDLTEANKEATVKIEENHLETKKQDENLNISEDLNIKQCRVCHKKETPEGEIFKLCSACKKKGKTIKYCSVDCQKKDWPTHKPTCGTPK